ncbi:methyltransferase domain-containing protein [Verticiella sediminum]|uniref:Methyltransferase domain-containing protein n=1 Tax=Verticiella sediminum TaxID=1247510 RepID=A0A556AER8_9BURK|nr:methyltransferase regulatory domain-containing protein [Verticiella sediminum]TSH91381.1 methyltransferase domain-containing protein [Verticiella sediminum]
MNSWTQGYVADIGYTHGYYREMSPALMAFALLERRVVAPGAEQPLAYCELGCGQGVTANLIAAANPQIEVHANDFNPAHIAGAQRLAAEAGTPNVRFYEHSFQEFIDVPGLPQFDMICLHGIYSWVDAVNRTAIAEFLRRKLKPGGVAYVSYNTQPGWAAAAPLRHLIHLHASQASGSTPNRLQGALAFARGIADAKGIYFRANPAAAQRLDRIQTEDPNYVAHEYLNGCWQPFAFSEVESDMGEAKLEFAASATLLDHVDVINLSPEQQQLMGGIANTTLRETTRDLLVGQAFRRDLYVKGRIDIPEVVAQGQWARTRIVLLCRAADVPRKVQAPLGEATLHEDIYGPLLAQLESGPRAIRELLGVREIAEHGWLKLRQAIQILLGLGHVDICVEGAAGANRAERVRAFNRAVLARAPYSAELRVLASPLTGGAVGVDRLHQLFLYADSQRTEPATFAIKALLAQNQRLLRDGKLLEDDAEHTAEMERRHRDFRELRLPVLQRLGVV